MARRYTPNERQQVEQTLLDAVDADAAPLLLRSYIADTRALLGEQPVPCQECSAPIPRDRVVAARTRGVEPRYCSDRCRSTAAKRRQRAS
jgi:predicted nucleic acid-binding Zn ribbon protein